ncbi:acyltransferase [Winogradskyella vincentii]|uniref:Acyltransferase n=1 Tax=Winogradskyella vincentii TaxID=2877122 RepID=A0ABS7Y1H2_9FLAO|nr:acyltransferase [Winogradskyella vincentii]MCA0153742.1 acyltransferase [Winogradskyella vincentii]
MTHKATWNKFSLSFIRKGFRFMFLHISMKFFIPPSLRTRILKSCGITFKNRKSVFIGTDVLFDNLKGTNTFIGENVTITTGTKIINHFPILSSNGVTEYSTGDITIGDNVFIGMNSLIIKPVNIGNGAVIGAGSVVTKDIPEKAIVGGNPAKIIDYVKDSKI